MLHLVLSLALSLAPTLPSNSAEVEVHVGHDDASAPAATTPDDEKRAGLAQYNVSKKGLALDGYDPVAYFPDYGGKATKGSDKITATHAGITYQFATEANKATFLKSPAAFEPQFGGWCAWAMADGKGDKVDVDPKSFTVEDGKLYVFYDGFFGDTRKSWNKGGGAPKLAANAAKNWGRYLAPPKK
ncbi:MAG: YHS domain-containing (seleno)protein [Planctomycetota bacterium]